MFQSEEPDFEKSQFFMPAEQDIINILAKGKQFLLKGEYQNAADEYLKA